ncbi:glycosyltransferase [Rhizobium sp. P32RR-XVIII]|uniref:glycosyltransferase n=1 Tax=Rhizobium sp. P32RR-XVIII TaxID=2726738 RepID=UPI0014575ABF|nr:nucleotide disphospho-sugar-binding domain-containing protein [Rhizobium sp. P32RR-XVIII]NLS06948.1 glycosyltransferase [Rhizobium sp. P32RR-XVIII]
MNILIVSTPATGHLNPLLAVGRILIAEGHRVLTLSGTALRKRIESITAEFHPLPPAADFDPEDIHSIAPELKTMPPGPEWLRIALERVFVDTIPAQHLGLQQVLRDFPADVVIGDDMFFGLLPMLLGPRSKRPPIVLCGTSILHWRREDNAPHFAGLPPAVTKAQHEEYAAIAQEHDRLVSHPIARRADLCLMELGVRPLSTALFDSVVELADAYMQLSVPSFEFPRKIPTSVNFVGVPPFIPNQAPLPPFAHELDGSRKVVLVTQGTVANHDFNLLVAPTLAALADESDVLVVATAGGRPTDAIPGPIPSNARLASYLPFEWLLPKVDVLVTNGGYGSVNQALSLGIPLVTAGLTEDKADVNARVAWSGVGIDLKTNEPTPAALKQAIRTVLDEPCYRSRALLMAEDFAEIDTRSEILRIVNQAANRSADGDLRMEELAIAARARLARRQ